jgi:hypothetical protein
MVIQRPQPSEPAMTVASQYKLPPVLPALLLALLVVRLIALFGDVGSAPRFVDEESNIYSAYYYTLFVLDRDFAHADWQNPVSYDYPPVGKYIYGFALHLFNGKIIDSCAGYKRWHERTVRDWFLLPLREQLRFLEGEKAAKHLNLIKYCEQFLNDVAGAPKPPALTMEDYKACRWTSFAFAMAATALLSIVVFALSRCNLSASLFAALIFLTNDVTMPGFQQALNDSMWCFFTLSCLLILFQLFRVLNGTLQWHRIMLFSVLVGLLLDLAIQTKLIAAYMAATVVISLAGSFVLGGISNFQAGRTILGKKEFASAVALTAISFVSLAFFVFLHPFLHHDTIHRIQMLKDHRDVIMQVQAATQGPAIGSMTELVQAHVRHGILLSYEFDDAPGLLLLYAYMLVVGLALLVRRALGDARCGVVSASGVACAWILAAYLVVAPKIHMDWERYFLPFVMCSTVLMAIGVGAHLNALQTHVLQWRNRGAAGNGA